MLMFTEKLDAELHNAVDTLLQTYGRTELLRVGPSMTEPRCTPVSAQNKVVFRKIVEFCPKWKSKKWIRRLVSLRHDSLVIYKGEEVRQRTSVHRESYNLILFCVTRNPLDNKKRLSWIASRTYLLMSLSMT